MKLTKFLSIVSLTIMVLSLSGCNKEPDPIVLTGSWQLDSASTFLQIFYNPAIASENPGAIQFLQDNKEKILNQIKKPEIIQFVEPNTVNFLYKTTSTTPLTGTFEQFEIYVSIKNSIFPNGITGASNNQKLEIYYDKTYMLGILNSILTPEDDSQETFSALIEAFDGVGVYVRAVL